MFLCFYFIFLPNQIISTELSQHNNVEKWKFQHVCVQQMYTANIYYGWLLSCFDMFEIVWTVSRGDNLTMLHLNDYKSLVVVHLTRTNQTCTFFLEEIIFWGIWRHLKSVLTFQDDFDATLFSWLITSLYLIYAISIITHSHVTYDLLPD